MNCAADEVHGIACTCFIAPQNFEEQEQGQPPLLALPHSRLVFRFGVWGWGLRVRGVGFEVRGLGIGVWDVGFKKAVMATKSMKQSRLVHGENIGFRV